MRILAFLLFMFIPVMIYAAEPSIWVEAVGEAIGSEYDPPIEVMERAKNDAKRNAIEEAVGSFINSHTLVANSQLAEDLIYAQLRGQIERVQDVVEERDKSNPYLYRVKLKALVKPIYPENGDGIQVKLDISKKNLVEGEEVKIFYQTSADSYVYIFAVASDNSVTVLLPNSDMKNNFVKSNAWHVFPPESCSIKLQAMCLPSFKKKLSEEKVKIIATRHKELLLEKGFQEGIFQVFDSNSTGLVGDLSRRLNRINPSDWGESMIEYTIFPK